MIATRDRVKQDRVFARLAGFLRHGTIVVLFTHRDSVHVGRVRALGRTAVAIDDEERLFELAVQDVRRVGPASELARGNA